MINLGLKTFDAGEFITMMNCIEDTFIGDFLKVKIKNESKNILSEVKSEIKKYYDEIMKLEVPVTFDNLFLNITQSSIDHLLSSIAIDSNSCATNVFSIMSAYNKDIVMTDLVSMVNPKLYKQKWSEMVEKFDKLIQSVLDNVSSQSDLMYTSIIAILTMLEALEFFYYRYFYQFNDDSTKTEYLSDEILVKHIMKHIKNITTDLAINNMFLLTELNKQDVTIAPKLDLSNMLNTITDTIVDIRNRSRHSLLIYTHSILSQMDNTRVLYSKNKYEDCLEILTKIVSSIDTLLHLLNDDNNELAPFYKCGLIVAFTATGLHEKYVKYYFTKTNFM